MKAKVIATGEIIYDIDEKQFDYGRYQVHGRTKDGESVFYDSNEVIVLPNELRVENAIDWEQRRYELIKAAMQGLVSKYGLSPYTEINERPESLYIESARIADRMIYQMKKKEKS